MMPFGGNMSKKQKKRCLIDSVWVYSLSRAINKQSKKAVCLKIR